MKKGFTIAMIALCVFLFLPVVYASELVIDDVKVRVSGKSKSVSVDGGTTINVKPEDTIKIQIKYKNNYPSGGQEISGIFVEGILEGIDDGEDLVEYYDEFDLKATRKKTVKFEYSIPLMLEEDGEYSLIISAIDGTDDNGTPQEIPVEYFIAVNKDRHKLKISKLLLESDELKCYRSDRLRVSVVNIGRSDEDDVKLTVKNSYLGIDFSKSFELFSGTASDSTEDVSVSFDVPEDALPGTYTIDVTASYRDDDYSESGSIDLIVEDCPAQKTETSGDTAEQDETETVAVVTTASTPPATIVSAVPPALQQSFWDRNKYALLVGLAYAAVIAIVIGLALNYASGRQKPGQGIVE